MLDIRYSFRINQQDVFQVNMQNQFWISFQQFEKNLFGIFLFINNGNNLIQQMAMNTKKKLNVCDDRRKSLRSSAKSQILCDQPLSSSESKKASHQIQLQMDNQQLITTSKLNIITLEDCKLTLQNNNQHTQQTKISDKDSPIKKISSDDSSHQKQISSQNHEQINEISIEACIKEKYSSQIQDQQICLSNQKNQIRSKKYLQFSPYVQQRKSYRKQNRKKINSIPYRKCQDQFQQRIVTIINKMQHNKNYQKDLQNLSEKVQKISNKDIFNKYVISGLQTILNMMKKTDNINLNCLKKLQNEQSNLKNKILEELNRTDEYEQIQFQERIFDISEVKPKMMRKIYKMLKKKSDMTSEQAKQKTIQQFSQFFKETQNNLLNDNLLKFLKNFNQV